MQRRDEMAWRQFSVAYSGKPILRFVILWIRLMEAELETSSDFDAFALRTYRQSLIALRLHDQNAQALGAIIQDIARFWEYGPELLDWYMHWTSS